MFPISRNAFTALLEKRVEGGSFKVFDRVADDRDLVKWAEIGELQPRLVAQHGRFHLMKRHQLESSFEIAGNKCVSGDEEPQDDDPFRRCCRVKERERDFCLIRDY